MNLTLHLLDPLNPFLFLICSEGLSTLLLLAIGKGHLTSALASINGQVISHLLFTDDNIIFGDASYNGAMEIVNILHEYSPCLGQCVNFDKFTLFFSSNVSTRVQRNLARVIGMRISNNSKRYLCLSNLVRRNKRASFQSLIDKAKNKIEGWSYQFLSQSGNEIFIKSVLQAILTYAMLCFILLISFCSVLEQLFAKFWWQKRWGKIGIH